jgi:hypothetical protein
LIDDQFLASIGRPTDSGFAQPEVLANLRCRQAHMSNIMDVPHFQEWNML